MKKHLTNSMTFSWANAALNRNPLLRAKRPATAKSRMGAVAIGIWLVLLGTTSPAVLAEFSCSQIGQERCLRGAIEVCQGRQHPFGNGPSAGSRGLWERTGRPCPVQQNPGYGASPIASPAECSAGDSRCTADNQLQNCSGGRWFTLYGIPCSKPPRQETQLLCTPGDQKCGPRGTILECRSAPYDSSKYAWNDTGLGCSR